MMILLLLVRRLVLWFSICLCWLFVVFFSVCGVAVVRFGRRIVIRTWCRFFITSIVFMIILLVF